MAGFSAQPPVETLAYIFSETDYSANLDMEALERVAKYFTELAPRRKPGQQKPAIIDPGILIHQIPGGMISNFRSQLEMQNALDKLPDALEEVAAVRKDLGYPPLVTPTSQIVGTQAVMNVLAGERYKIVPNEVKNYLRGLYGRSPGKIDQKLMKKILGDEKPIKHRPADSLKSMLPGAAESMDPALVEHEEDIVSYCILPEPALEFFKWRKMPPEQRSPIPADLELKKMADEINAEAKNVPAAASAAKIVSGQMIHLEDYRGLALLLSKARGLNLESLAVKKGDFALSFTGKGAVASGNNALEIESEMEEAALESAREPKQPAPAVQASPKGAAHYANAILAPLVGTFYSSPGPGKSPFAKVGDTIKAGEKVCIVEAMKLFNEIAAPVDCKLVRFLVQDGDTVEKDQPLIAYEPL